jgi:hypothetical protein
VDDLEDWEHVLEGVAESTERAVDEDAIQSELESLIQEGLVEAYEPSSRTGRLTPTKPKRSELRDELRYWFFPTEAGMRLYCNTTGAPFPTRRIRQW